MIFLKVILFVTFVLSILIFFIIRKFFGKNYVILVQRFWSRMMIIGLLYPMIMRKIYKNVFLVKGREG